MVTITIFGVGYGEVQPLDTPGLKVFTMGVIVAGCSSGIYVVGGFVQLIAEGEINRALGARSMSRGIEKLSGHAIVCGYGRVGQILARDLATAGQPFVAVDNSESRVAAAHAAGFLALLGSASDDESLLAAGIQRARVLATVLPDDAANVFVTLTARELNPKIEIIARAEYPSTEQKLIRSGANQVVMPAAIGATKIANMVTRPSAEAMLQESIGRTYLNDELKQIGLEMMEFELDEQSPLVGQTVGSVESEGPGGFVVVAIKHKSGDFVRNPPPEQPLQSGDMFLILGHIENVPQLVRRAAPRASITYRGSRA
jgi:voltage-gated potassium channel